MGESPQLALLDDVCGVVVTVVVVDAAPRVDDSSGVCDVGTHLAVDLIAEESLHFGCECSAPVRSDAIPSVEPLPKCVNGASSDLFDGW